MNTLTNMANDPVRILPRRAYYDPLDPDQDDDLLVHTSRRGLTRLALVASEAGARFQREAVGHDVMAWMLAPRQLFDGASALEACLERDHCLRATMLHGLSLGIDASPASIDELLADGPTSDGLDEDWEGMGRPRVSHRPARTRLRLYSATIVAARGGELLQAFHASVAPSAAVVRERIRARFGATVAAQAVVRVGYDPDDPATMGMVPPALMKNLIEACGRRGDPARLGFDLTVEQRISS